MVLTQNQWETYSRLLERKRRTQEKSKRKWATTLEPSRSSVAMTVTPNENIDPNIVESVAVAISGGSIDDESPKKLKVASKQRYSVERKLDREKPEWYRRFNLYQQFVAETGLQDPSGNVQGTMYSELAQWASTNRSYPKKLDPYQLQRLQEAGFVFTKQASKNSSIIDEKLDEIETKYQQHMNDPKTKDKKFHIPAIIKGKNNPLGKWISQQRSTNGKILDESQKKRLVEMIGTLEPLRKSKSKK